MSFPIPPLLSQFGDTPQAVVSGFVSLNRFWIVELLERMADRTGVTEFTTYDQRARKTVTLSLVPHDGMSNNALALQLILWMQRSAGEVKDEVNRFVQNLPVGIEGDCSCISPNKNPHQDAADRRFGELRGLFGVDDAVIVTGILVAGALAVLFIGFCSLVAIIVLPGLMEIAAIEILEDDYFKAKAGGAEFSGDQETAVRAGVGMTLAGGTMISSIATGQGGLNTPEVEKLVLESTDNGTRGGANMPPADDVEGVPLLWIGAGLLALAVIR